MSDRKLELERKKAKLQAIREEKERRRREKEQLDLEESAAKTGNVGEKDFRKWVIINWFMQQDDIK